MLVTLTSHFHCAGEHKGDLKYIGGSSCRLVSSTHRGVVPVHSFQKVTVCYR